MILVYSIFWGTAMTLKGVWARRFAESIKWSVNKYVRAWMAIDNCVDSCYWKYTQ